MKWFKNLNAVAKLMLALGGVLCFLLPIGYLAITQISLLSERSLQIFDRDVGGIEAIKQAEVDQAILSRILAMAVVSQGNSAGVASAEREFASVVTDLRSSLALGYARSIHPQLRGQLQSATSLIPGFEQAAQTVFTHAKNGNQAAAIESLSAALVSADRLRAVVHQAAVMKQANVATVRVDEGNFIQRVRTQFYWLMGAAVTFGLLTSFAIARWFSVPLNQAVALLARVERGDLTQRLQIDSHDEIGKLARALNAALANIQDVMAQVGEASQDLTTASSQLAQSADVLARGTHEQAASLEQTSASLEQITATVRQNSDNARQASQFALSSRDAAEKGGTVVHSAMSAMTEINDASAKIAAIIRVIDEIAFQTNLLAVNASVEAARAREHGKGFAVVATEVRTLAQRSGTAAKEIKALIGDSRRKVENGSTLVNRSGQTLTDIVASVKRVTDIVGEIAAASREQSSGIEQVNSAMLQMDRVMQSNSSQTEQLSATAKMLASNAAQLEQIIGRFVVAAKPVAATAVPVPIAQASPRFPAVAADPVSATTTAALSGLAANLGQTVSTAALDEEFEEF